MSVTYAQMYQQAYRFVEFFSGEANATWCLKHWGLQGICFDNSYGGHWNNIFEPSGFACFACSFCWTLHVFFVDMLVVYIMSNVYRALVKRNPDPTQWAMMTRCAIVAILQLHPKSLVLLAPVCSGFSFMVSSQAMRFFYSPLGNEDFPWVKSGNIMSCRVTLLCWLCCALGHVFILEQPSSARFGDMPRWRYFCDNIAYVFRQQKFVTV